MAKFVHFLSVFTLRGLFQNLFSTQIPSSSLPLQRVLMSTNKKQYICWDRKLIFQTDFVFLFASSKKPFVWLWDAKWDYVGIQQTGEFSHFPRYQRRNLITNLILLLKSPVYLLCQYKWTQSYRTLQDSFWLSYARGSPPTPTHFTTRKFYLKGFVCTRIGDGLRIFYSRRTLKESVIFRHN